MENIQISISLDEEDKKKLAEIEKAARALADALTAFTGDDQSES